MIFVISKRQNTEKRQSSLIKTSGVGGRSKIRNLEGTANGFTLRRGNFKHRLDNIQGWQPFIEVKENRREFLAITNLGT